MKIGFVSLGCPRAVSDLEAGLGQLCKTRPVTIVQDPASADLVIVNTCGFIESAKTESLEAIFDVCRLKRTTNVKHVLVAGCLPQRYGNLLLEKIPEVDAYVGTDDYGDLSGIVDKMAGDQKVYSVRRTPGYLPGARTPRYRLTPPHVALVKISEGCRHGCAYCAIPRMRGPQRSRTVASVCQEVRELIATGTASEIDLIGQDTTAFGLDRSSSAELGPLLRRLARIAERQWIRVLYAHPAHLDRSMVSAIADHKQICRYLDIPIEHADEGVLKRMHRKGGRAQIERCLEMLRKGVPGITLRTSVIVGFPGETEKEFKAMADFLRACPFERLGVFKYSREEQTAAYSMKGQVSARVKEERFAILMEQQRWLSRKRNRGFVGTDAEVLIDAVGKNGTYLGRTQSDAIDIDGTVKVVSGRTLRVGQFVRVRITGYSDYDLSAKVC